MNTMGTWGDVLFWLGIVCTVAGFGYVIAKGWHARAAAKGPGPRSIAAEELEAWVDRIIGPLIEALVKGMPVAMFGLLLSAGALWVSAKGYWT
ncbi:MAG: hypothetical protein ABI317_12930 [Gaiellales bacterium]